VVFHDYPLPGRRGLYAGGKVALVGEDGAMIETHADIRGTFVGARRWHRWPAADALYFFGYALTGVPIAERRHVVGRIGRWPTPVVALNAELEIASEPAT
jgi:hypothetical protein